MSSNRIYKLKIATELPAEAAYPLYAELLKRAPRAFGDWVHDSGATPVSQHIRGDEWHITLMGEQAVDALAPAIERMDKVFLHRFHQQVEIVSRQALLGKSPEQLLEDPVRDAFVIRFHTPTAFKSAGRYQLLPTQRLIVQSLISKWNACFGEECPIEDEGGGLEALADGLRYERISLTSETYRMKNVSIPGVLGAISATNQLNDFHRTLLNALLEYGTYSGVGIKTALGMGGITIEKEG